MGEAKRKKESPVLTLEVLKKQLEAFEDLKIRLENTYQQTLGQIKLLKEQIKHLENPEKSEVKENAKNNV